MRMLSVCYAKVKVMLNRCKVGMLSLGYGNVKTRLRQNCSLTYVSAHQWQLMAHWPGIPHVWELKSWELGAEQNNEALLNLC